MFRLPAHCWFVMLWLVMLAGCGCWFSDVGRAEEPLREFTNSIGMKLTLIPAGQFAMGSGKTHDELLKLVTVYAGVDRLMQYEFPQHTVRITRPFYLGTTEVTQGQWERVMGTRPWTERPQAKESAAFGERWGADFPAIWVNWDEAQEFCSRLSQRDGPIYRLPTEAEWEYACRAGTKTIYSFGDDGRRLPEFAWFSDNAYRQQGEKFPHASGLRKPNPWGLHEMHGNVWEWCSDRYGAAYYQISPAQDPPGPADGAQRVIRGGSWRNSDNHCRSSFRVGLEPTEASNDLGFRVVAVIPADDGP